MLTPRALAVREEKNGDAGRVVASRGGQGGSRRASSVRDARGRLSRRAGRVPCSAGRVSRVRLDARVATRHAGHARKTIM